MSERFVIDKPIRLIELFGGIGTQAMAFRNIGADFERYRLVEFDKYCIASYNAIHGTDFKVQDITQIHGEDLGIVDTDKYLYVLTYSWPCQSVSVAGKMDGMSKGSGTRSALLWEVERLLNDVENLPQVLFWENVPQIHSKKNINDLNSWIAFLETKGYKTYYQDLNAKDFGVAQSRNRCYGFSFLGDYTYEFPKGFPLEKRIKDYLEPIVDKKYYITSDKAKTLIENLILNGKIDSLIIPKESEASRQTAGVDLSYSRAETNDDYAYCIKARYDAGINRPIGERTGVCEVDRLS